MINYEIPKEFDAAIRFTEAFHLYENEHIAIREAMCIKSLYPVVLKDIQDGDLFAGRVVISPAGFRATKWCLEVGYYCYEDRIKSELERNDLPESYKKQFGEMIDFWKTRTTIHNVKSKYVSSGTFPPEIEAVLHYTETAGQVDETPLVIDYGYRMAGTTLNFEKLLKLGIPGMMKEVEYYREKAVRENGDAKLYDGMRICLELLVDISRYYAGMAIEMAETANNAKRKQELQKMANVLENITVGKPQTFQEAIQLFWLYVIISGVENYGRMDVYLGGFCADDLDSERITEEKALYLLQSLWRLIMELNDTTSCRVFLGGAGRPDERKKADRFALLAMEATRTVKGLAPVISLRLYKGMDPKLFSKALDVIGEGAAMPILFNDEVNIAGVAKTYGASIEEAEQYVTCDCGEFRIDHRTLGSPNASINLMKILELTLHNGYDPLSKLALGLKTGGLASFKMFEELWEAYKNHVEFFIRFAAEQVMPVYREMQDRAFYLFFSMLFDGCLEEGKSLVQGAPYKGGFIETYGNITVADSLLSIKRLVYEEKVVAPERLLEALKANFEGYEKERRLMQDVPKYGNDNTEADSMAVAVHKHITSATVAEAVKLDIDFFLNDFINANGNVTLGAQVGASPDGRLAGMPLSNANGPTLGNDRSGITALLNSLVKLDISDVGGQVQNLKLSRDMFTKYRDKLESLLNVYFSSGGSQIMITVVDRTELENAVKEPEKYGNLAVRVGGFNAWFVTLDKGTQEDIIARTLY